MNAADKLQARLELLRACEEAREWCEGKSFKQAWNECKNEYWMFWLFEELNGWLLSIDIDTGSKVYVAFAFGKTSGPWDLARVREDAFNQCFDEAKCCDAIREVVPFSKISRAMSKIKV